MALLELDDVHVHYGAIHALPGTEVIIETRARERLTQATLIVSHGDEDGTRVAVQVDGRSLPLANVTLYVSPPSPFPSSSCTSSTSAPGTKCPVEPSSGPLATSSTRVSCGRTVTCTRPSPSAPSTRSPLMSALAGSMACAT